MFFLMPLGDFAGDKFLKKKEFPAKEHKGHKEEAKKRFSFN
jgi:hypothetical protein